MKSAPPKGLGTSTRKRRRRGKCKPPPLPRFRGSARAPGSLEAAPQTGGDVDEKNRTRHDKPLEDGESAAPSNVEEGEGVGIDELAQRFRLSRRGASGQHKSLVEQAKQVHRPDHQ